MQSKLMMRVVSPRTKLGQSHHVKKGLSCQHLNCGRRGNSVLRFASKGGSSETGDGNNGTQVKQLDEYFRKLRLSVSKNENRIGNDRKIDRVDSAAGKFSRISDFVANAKRSVRYESTDSNKSDARFLISEEKFKRVPTESEDSDFSLINVLVAINIAVLLFETASPIRDDDLEYVSLPFFYGAKVNKLILLGEWWRLLTPMFLHAGFFHVVLGCWGLLTFGPRVCRAYGPVTFFLIYLLGGICGNFTSFLHTPELTVCGTGPLFAIIGAWLIYQVQNKDAIPKDVLESMFQRAVLVTLLSFILSCFERIDNWSHLGATLSGLAYGYFTCPSLELDNANTTSKDGRKEGVALMQRQDGRKEGVALMQRQSSPCKSVAIFTISVILLTSLVLLYGMQPELLDFEDSTASVPFSFAYRSGLTMFNLSSTESAGSLRSLIKLPIPSLIPESFMRTISMMIFTSVYAPVNNIKRTIADINAISLSPLIATPVLSTTPLRSTSVSKTTLRSASLASTASRASPIAFGSSGCGMWFGNIPSGSKWRLPIVLAPSLSRTAQGVKMFYLKALERGFIVRLMCNPFYDDLSEVRRIHTHEINPCDCWQHPGDSNPQSSCDILPRCSFAYLLHVTGAQPALPCEELQPISCVCQIQAGWFLVSGGVFPEQIW